MKINKTFQREKINSVVHEKQTKTKAFNAPNPTPSPLLP